MKFFQFCQLAVLAMLLAGCAGTSRPEADIIRSDFPEVWCLQDCLKHAPDTPEAKEAVIRSYFALAGAQLMDAELMKQIPIETDPVKKQQLQEKCFDIISRRNLSMINLCEAMQIHLGTHLKLDFQLPARLKPALVMSKSVLEKAALQNGKDPKHFHVTWLNLHVAREKFEFYQQTPPSPEKQLQLIQSYADYCRCAHELALLCDLPISTLL